jgi:undecaprenyl-diphosphatase
MPPALSRGRSGAGALRVAAAAAAAYAALGLYVARRPPAGLDAAATALAGHGLPAATILSAAGLFPAYAALCVLSLVVALARRAWLPQTLTAIAALVVAWRISDACKAIFARPRPALWFVHHETSFSYPSGHATLALTFYGFWAYVAWTNAASPRRWPIVVLLAAWTAAVGWSRLALGAHYPSDVLGGYLLGAAVLGLAVAVYERARSGNARPARQKSAEFVRGKSL